MGKKWEFTGILSRATTSRKLTVNLFYFIFPILALNCQSGSTAIAQLNLSRNVLEKIFSMGTSLRLHQATDMRGSM